MFFVPSNKELPDSTAGHDDSLASTGQGSFTSGPLMPGAPGGSGMSAGPVVAGPTVNPSDEVSATPGGPGGSSMSGGPVVAGPTVNPSDEISATPGGSGGLLPLSHDIADYPEGIVLPIDKPYRWTSADVIRKLKWKAIRHFGKKNLKVGHAGTLDPLATGILLVCIGDACKRAQQLQDHDKEYIARIRFGATTPSYDLEKDVDRRFPYEHITADAVRAALPAFLGEQEQVAPLFSAKSVDGVRAYELARKLYRSGRTDELDAAALETLQRNRICISELELLDFRCAGAGSDPLSEEIAASLSKAGVISQSEAGAGSLPNAGENALSETSSSGAASRPASASNRINVADTSALGLPEAVIRIACSKGTYIRAFARDLGEALGSGAHLSGLIRSRSGHFRLPDALSLDQALSLFL